MKYFLLAPLLLLAGAAPAQTVPAPASASVGPYRYCALVVTNDDYFSSANRMTLDYGRRELTSPADAVLEEAD